MSNKIQVFDLSNASDVSLTSTGFKREGDSAKYVCKITDATIVFVGDNSKFTTDKKKLCNDITITLPKEQSENLCALLDATEKDMLPYRTNDNDEVLFKVKMRPDMRIMDKDKKPIRINIMDVPCIALRDYKEATVDIALTGVSKEFDTEDGGVISFTTLTATQMKVIDKDDECDYDIL